MHTKKWMSHSQIKSEVVPSLANHFVIIPGWQGSVVSNSFCQRSVTGSCNVFHKCFCHHVQSTKIYLVILHSTRGSTFQNLHTANPVSWKKNAYLLTKQETKESCTYLVKFFINFVSHACCSILCNCKPDSSTTFSILETGTILNGNQHFSTVSSY